ncbi:MAG: DUF885 domain-containing protein [Vicinamibacteria bacterium]|nr:DUF885 domain-containing protein [Vicinamibacteria bacterium]
MKTTNLLSKETLALGRRAMTALLGVDALYRRESADGDGLAVVNLDLERRYAPDAFSGYTDAARCFEELRTDAQRLPEPDRRLYFDALCHSTLAFITWRRTGLPFVEQIHGFLHVPAEPAPADELAALQNEMGALLTRMGYTGDLRSQCAAWEEKNRVRAEQVPAVLEGLLDEAWRRTEERVVRIPRPKSDGMHVVPVSGVAFNARCNYLSRRIELNVDPVLTRPGLKHLAVHEGYPGHYLQFTLRSTMAESGEASADVLLSIVNSASSSIFEGIGDSGITMLDWMESDDDRVQALMNVYRAGIGTEAAWRFHALGWPAQKVADALSERSLVGGDGWVANRVKFIQSPSRAVLIWSYWWGERVVTRAWNRVGAYRRDTFLPFLYGRMHSNASIELFE